MHNHYISMEQLQIEHGTICLLGLALRLLLFGPEGHGRRRAKRERADSGAQSVFTIIVPLLLLVVALALMEPKRYSH